MKVENIDLIILVTEMGDILLNILQLKCFVLGDAVRLCAIEKLKF